MIGVIENMSWFRGDDGTAYELFGAGGGEELADQLDVPLLGQVPLVPAAAARVATTAARSSSPIPTTRRRRSFRAIAEHIDIELAPKRIYRTELKIV